MVSGGDGKLFGHFSPAVAVLASLHPSSAEQATELQLIKIISHWRRAVRNFIFPWQRVPLLASFLLAYFFLMRARACRTLFHDSRALHPARRIGSDEYLSHATFLFVLINAWGSSIRFISQLRASADTPVITSWWKGAREKRASFN